MFQYMEHQGIANIRQNPNIEINGYIQNDISVVPPLVKIAWIKSKIYYTNLYGTIRGTKLKEK